MITTHNLYLLASFDLANVLPHFILQDGNHSVKHRYIQCSRINTGISVKSTSIKYSVISFHRIRVNTVAVSENSLYLSDNILWNPGTTDLITLLSILSVHNQNIIVLFYLHTL